MTRSREAWVKFLATRIVAVAADAVIVGFAYLAAFLLRFDFSAPRWGWRAVALSYLTVGAVHVLALFACGCYRLAWRRIRVCDLPRYVGAMALACLVLTGLRFWLSGEAYFRIRPPYSINLMCFVLATAGIIAARVFWRLYMVARAKELGTGDLLERRENTFDNAVAARFLNGKTVMVTGAGGSIGSEIARQVAAAGARRILLVERCENALYEIDRRMRGLVHGRVELVPLMMDCGNRARMERVFDEHRPQVVLHAAASKHVPMVELNPEEGWSNNVEGTRTVAELAKAHGVARFVLISTDKAVNPVSVMGKTKLAAEGVVMGMNEGGKTSFCAVRFGNVFGSSGSVVPLFREQIVARRPVTVTHPDMKRYFMTIQEAVGLVLQAASREERAIYTLDMGEPVRILDLAEGMIAHEGYRPYVDIPIVFIGIRPGEKLFEELDISEKSAFKTDMAKIYVTKTKTTQEGERA